MSCTSGGNFLNIRGPVGRHNQNVAALPVLPIRTMKCVVITNFHIHHQHIKLTLVDRSCSLVSNRQLDSLARAATAFFAEMTSDKGSLSSDKCVFNLRFEFQYLQRRQTNRLYNRIDEHYFLDQLKV
jgi:hypothetical protein